MEVNSKSVLSMISRRFGLKRSTIEDRMQLQKIVYLLQASEIRLGYGFGWNKYGPYSQDLADDAYAVLSIEPKSYKETEKWAFDDTTEKKLKSFDKFLSKFKNDYKMLELVTSVDFMNCIWGISLDPLDDFMNEFRVRKKSLLVRGKVTKEDVKKAVELWKELQSML